MTHFFPTRPVADLAVTGGGRGFGKGMAVEFARLGAKVAILSRKPDHRESGLAAMRTVGAEAIAVACDVREPEAIARAFDEIEAKLGPVDVLINKIGRAHV